jgi:GNAT superfamily N-acetyltransferase
VTAIRIVAFEPRFGGACESMIAELPEWFGLAEANAAYLRDLAALSSWVALLGSDVVGAVTLERHFPESFEVHFLAVRPEHHRRGIGRTLLRHVEAEVRARGGGLLHAKTLAPSHPDPWYARTRAFYAAMGFAPLFETSALWGSANPAVVLVKALGPHEPPAARV